MNFKLKPGVLLIDRKYNGDYLSTAIIEKSATNDNIFWHLVRIKNLYGNDTLMKELNDKFTSWPENIRKLTDNCIAIEFPRIENFTPATIIPVIRNTNKQPKMIVVTSISPSHNSIGQQEMAIKSWQKLGLKIYSLNCKDELIIVKPLYKGVTFVETKETGENIFGKPYVKINALIDFGASQDCDSFMLINSDVIIDYRPEILYKIAYESQQSFIYIIRYDYSVEFLDGKKQPWGIDAFVFNKVNCKILTKQDYCLGQPWFDNWIPDRIANAKIPTYEISFPFLFHKKHKEQWSKQTWETCSQWFNREVFNSKYHASAAGEMNRVSRDAIEANAIRLTINIHDKIFYLLRDIKKPVIFELGANTGQDTIKLSDIPGSTIYAFECDKRCIQDSYPDNVIMNLKAISKGCGEIEFIQSDTYSGRDWNCSGSIKKPKGHLNQYPQVTFKKEKIKVEAISLDLYCKENKIKNIDFIWADLQGAEEDMIIGGSEILKKTRYIYTEYSDTEMYEGQINLAGILKLLPGWEVVELINETETNVLLKNKKYAL